MALAGFADVAGGLLATSGRFTKALSSANKVDNVMDAASGTSKSISAARSGDNAAEVAAVGRRASNTCAGETCFVAGTIVAVHNNQEIVFAARPMAQSESAETAFVLMTPQIRWKTLGTVTFAAIAWVIIAPVREKATEQANASASRRRERQRSRYRISRSARLAIPNLRFCAGAS